MSKKCILISKEMNLVVFWYSQYQFVVMKKLQLSSYLDGLANLQYDNRQCSKI